MGYDNVIIINARNEIYGFPSKIEDDPVLQYVIKDDKSIEYAEERRLFYVAMTRTKNRVYIVTPEQHPSEFILELIKDYPNIKLDIFGTGEIKEELLAEIEEKGLQNNVFLKGWTTNTVKEYCEHDIYLMTSNFEGMPNSLMEAMAVGLPCISTDCETGPSDLIDDGVNGYLVKVNNATELAEKIKQIIAYYIIVNLLIN